MRLEEFNQAFDQHKSAIDTCLLANPVSNVSKEAARTCAFITEHHASIAGLDGQILGLRNALAHVDDKKARESIFDIVEDFEKKLELLKNSPVPNHLPNDNS